MKPDRITNHTLALSEQVLIIADGQALYTFEPRTGRPYGTTQPHYRHITDIACIDVEKSVDGSLLALLDKSHELHLLNLSGASKSIPVRRIASLVQSMKFSEDTSYLAYLSDGTQSILYTPLSAFVDTDLVAMVTAHNLSGVKGATMGYFSGTQLILRRADGAVSNVPAISPHPVLLRELIRKKHWEDAVKLCRYLQVSSHPPFIFFILYLMISY